MVEPEPGLTAGQRLGAQESLGISTLDPGHKPPAMPPGRQVSVRVHLLDDTEEVFDVSQRASGRVLLDLVCAHLNLIEGDYFGLEYQNHRKMTVWLDLLKPTIKQIRRPKHTVLRFVVKFFPPDHTQLLEELTRYLFALQVKQDLACGVLTCNDSSAALLVSHIVQSEIGDFDETQSREHLLTNRYMPDQEALLDRIMDCHRKHTGQTPAESDYQLLEIARRLEMYGMRLHPAKDREGTKLSLAVAHTGVLVFQGHTRINAFNWSKIRKLSFKRKRFLIKLRPDLNQSAYQDTLEFLMGSRDCCKVFWKICVEYHAFFRLFEEPKPKPKPVLFTRGSSFRFSGRTQKQVFDYVRDSEFKKIPFERKHSRVQSHSSQSPLPSLQRPQVPKESVISSSGDELDSPSRSGWRETVSVSVEDSSASRKKSSPSPQRNGREERAGPRVEPSPSGQRAERLSTGPARRAAQAGPAPIPYTDHSGVDNEREPSPPRPRPARPRPRTYEYYFEEDEPVVRGGGVNGGYRRVHRRSVGYGEYPTFHCPELTDEDPVGVSPYEGMSTHGGVAIHGGVSPYRGVSTHGGVFPYGGMSPYGGVSTHGGMSTHGGVSPYGGVSPPSPYNSTLVDELFQGSVHRCPPVARCTDQFGPAEENGHEPWPAPWDEDGYDGGDRDFNPRPVLDEGPHYGRCSPATPRSSRSKKSLGPAPVPAHQPRPVFSRAERMAALERRMLANGLSTPGLSKPRPHLDHIGAVQMIDGSGSSGSESSESEMGGSSGRRLSCGDSAPSGGPSRTPLPRNKFSFGSLQLEEEVEEDGGFDFSDEDGVMMSCPRLSDSPNQGAVNGQRRGLAPGQSLDGPQPSPLTSPLLNDGGCTRTDDEDEVRRKRFPTDKAYFIAKELLTTERTYLKDLEVITMSFQNSVGKDEATPESLRNSISSNFEPLHKFHTSFLREVEQRLALWEGRSNAHIKGDYQRIGDVMLKNIQGIKQMTVHLQRHSEVLLELERACRASRRVEALCRDFELQKVCYLPLNVFLLRPLHRLMHYKQILERLCKHYPPTHQDFRDSRAALADVSEMVAQLHCPMIKMENFQKLLELKKDLVGIDNLAIPGREFIRLGCLSKLSGKGLQQRMFFLFNDVLLYTSRGMTTANQFKVHGQLPLYGMTIRESEDEWGVPHSFTLSGQRSSVVVAASSVSEMEKWMEDIKMAIDLAEKCNGPSSNPVLAGSPQENKSSEDPTLDQESEDDLSASRTSLQRQEAHRGNTTVHVCWHRNTSVSMLDFSIAVENQLSGNLLRKFKNSNGWQKLWVVFTNFSLFFYKTYQDDYPLASLPLLGYSVTIPSENENIHKDYVFKLHFKSHVYYFRSESEYTFERWMEVIRSATSSTSRTRFLSRKEPHPY